MSSVNSSPVDAVPGGPGPGEVPVPAPAPGRRVTFLNAPFRGRTYAELLYGFTGLPVAAFGFVLSVAFVALGTSTLVTVSNRDPLRTAFAMPSGTDTRYVRITVHIPSVIDTGSFERMTAHTLRCAK